MNPAQVHIPTLTAGKVSADTGAAALMSALPPANHSWQTRAAMPQYRATLAERGFEARILPKSSRKIQIPFDKSLYRKRHKIENMFGRLKDWRCIHTRYARTFMSVIAISWR